MKEKFNNTYIENFTFSQHLIAYDNDTIKKEEIWHEAYSFLGSLIVKVGSLESDSGYIFHQDTLRIISKNKVSVKMEHVNELTVLGFDISPDPIEKTVKRLTKQGFDLTKVIETKLRGRDVYCVGALSEDEQANKFYIDKENLYFVKCVKIRKHGISEVECTDFKEIGNQPVATKLTFYRNGKLNMTEDYFNIKLPDTIDSKLFDPEFFEHARW